MIPRYPHVRIRLSSSEARRKCTGFYVLLHLVRINTTKNEQHETTMKIVKESMDINNNLHNHSIHKGGPVAGCAEYQGRWWHHKGVLQPKERRCCARAGLRRWNIAKAPTTCLHTTCTMIKSLPYTTGRLLCALKVSLTGRITFPEPSGHTTGNGRHPVPCAAPIDFYQCSGDSLRVRLF